MIVSKEDREIHKKTPLYYIHTMVLFLSVFFCIWIIILYISVFRLSKETALSMIRGSERVQCHNTLNCIQPGDILIRRKITEQTEFFNAIANPYFTHTALYLGDGLIVEAVGSQPNPEDDVVVYPLLQSDWLQSESGEDMLKNNDKNEYIPLSEAYMLPEDTYVLRVHMNTDTILKIRESVSKIAEDPKIIFGFYTQGEYKTQCSKLIFDQLVSHKVVVDVGGHPKHITPDYVFWYLVKKNDSQLIVSE